MSASLPWPATSPTTMPDAAVVEREGVVEVAAGGESLGRPVGDRRLEPAQLGGTVGSSAPWSTPDLLEQHLALAAQVAGGAGEEEPARRDASSEQHAEHEDDRLHRERDRPRRCARACGRSASGRARALGGLGGAAALLAACPAGGLVASAVAGPAKAGDFRPAGRRTGAGATAGCSAARAGGSSVAGGRGRPPPFSVPPRWRPWAGAAAAPGRLGRGWARGRSGSRGRAPEWGPARRLRGQRRGGPDRAVPLPCRPLPLPFAVACRWRALACRCAMRVARARGRLRRPVLARAPGRPEPARSGEPAVPRAQ